MKTKQLLTRTRANAGSMYEIYFENGGQLPGSLTGLYSSQLEAEKAITTHLLGKETNATSKSTTGAEDI